MFHRLYQDWSRLEVASFAPVIYSASTPCRDRADAWEGIGSNGAFDSGFVLSSSRIYSFSSLASDLRVCHERREGLYVGRAS
jgi:hypothetical protein